MEEEVQNEEFHGQDDPLIELSKEQESWKSRALKWLSVFGVGFFTFVLGLVLFLPVNSLVEIALQSAAQGGMPLEVAEVDVSRRGYFNFSRIRYVLESSEPDKNSSIGIVYLEGKVSPWQFLFSDRLELNGMMTGVQLLIDPVTVSGGTWNYTVELDDFCDGMLFPAKGAGGVCDIMKWNGDIKITATDVMVKYQEITTKVSALELKGKVKNGSVELDVSTINSSLANIILQGSAVITGNGNLNIGVIAIPQQEAYEHEQLGMLLQAGKAQKIVQDDGKIEIRVTGPFKKINYSFTRGK